MSRDIPEPDPRSELEDEGIPDLQDSAPERAGAQDPQQAPNPRDYPVGVDDFGTTADEQAGGRATRSPAGPGAAGRAAAG